MISLLLIPVLGGFSFFDVDPPIKGDAKLIQALKDAQLANVAIYDHGEIVAEVVSVTGMGKSASREEYKVRSTWDSSAADYDVQGTLTTKNTTVKSREHPAGKPTEGKPTDRVCPIHFRYVTDGKLSLQADSDNSEASFDLREKLPLLSSASIRPQDWWFGKIAGEGLYWSDMIGPSKNFPQEKVESYEVRQIDPDRVEVKRFDKSGSSFRLVASWKWDGNVIEFESESPKDSYKRKITYEWFRDTKGRCALASSHLASSIGNFTQMRDYKVLSFDPDFRPLAASLKVDPITLPKGTFLDDRIKGERYRVGGGPVARGLTGKVSDIKVAVPESETIRALADTPRAADVDLKRMAQWAMNYLIRTPRRDLGFEPVFQCHPLLCPPVPVGQDPVVACDTDARMDWEWYYMREVSGSDSGREVEAAFHNRIRSYIADDGKVWSHPGAFNEGNIGAKYGEKDRIIHIWGATKILQSLAEHHARNKDAESKALARMVMVALKGVATWDDRGRCWFACGMGGLRPDGTVVPNGWNRQPAPIVGPLVTYWQATGDADGLAFARAYADGMLEGVQPDGLRFAADGRYDGHSHATMHAVWGVGRLGLVTGEAKYLNLAKGAFDYLLTRGTGTGWFPAGPDNCDETCCVSDMISIATVIGRSGHPEYFDYAERYLRNYISNPQFIVTPEFETYYRKLHADKGEKAVAEGLEALRKFQGGIIGGTGLNDFENELLGRVSSFEMFGCCAPEGMRAIHTAWTETIGVRAESKLGPAGVYVDMSFSRTSPWGEVVSFMPDAGRLTVKAAVRDTFFLRPPHWAPHDRVRTFVGTKSVPVRWSGDHVRFDAMPGDELTVTYPLIAFTHRVDGLWKGSAPNLRMTFQWLGNMVTAADPATTLTPLFLGKPRVLPPAPK